MPRPRKPWLTWLLVGGFFVGIVVWLGGRPIAKRWRSWQVTGTLTSVTSLMERKEWVLAANLLREAMQVAPNDPAVLRAVAEFQLSTHASPADVVQTFKRLHETGHATTADMVKLAHAEIRGGNIAAARKTLLSLSPAERSLADVMELESAILKMEGQSGEADNKLRTALLAQDADANAPLRLALLDFQQPFPAVHARGRTRLWDFARGRDGAACRAVQVLAADTTLTQEEADELLRLMQTHPDPGQAWLAAVQATLRLRPQERDAILARATERAGGGDDMEHMQFARWLSTMKEHERVLKFLPPDSVVKTEDLPADMLNLKLDAMAGTGRWEEVAAKLTPRLEKVLGKNSFNLWQACVAAKVKHDPARVRQHLSLAFEFAGRGQDVIPSLQTAETAARLEEWELAAAFFQSLADQMPAVQPRLKVLEKSFAMHGRNYNTSSMLKVAREISRLSPGNDAAAFRADYLGLLVGDSLELVAANTGPASAEAGTEAAARAHFLKAMANFRLRQPVPLHDLPQRMETSASWTAGHRAVLAAMIAANGDPEKAFRIAERVPVALLLPEEVRLLKLAR
ncbi:MAG: hypothetical protein NTY98_01385 [Verrucomicrobia bacterium]|nr:hypothetical protein [Verrucomicrobiota bacterium]